MRREPDLDFFGRLREVGKRILELMNHPRLSGPSMEKKDFDSGWRVLIPASDSATLRISTNIQKISILSALNEVLKERRSLEHRRNSLLQSAVVRQHQVQETQNKCEASWEEKIQEAQKIGDKYESECANLRERRDYLHRQLMIKIDKSTPHKILHNIPGLRANYKIQACQLQRDIADLKRRVNNAMFRLEAEKKTANSLSNTVKELRIEAGTKKFNSMSIRPRTLAILSHPPQCRSSRESVRSKNTPRWHLLFSLSLPLSDRRSRFCHSESTLQQQLFARTPP